MSPLPIGTVTFLFTDIEGSTRLWEEHPEAMRLALARHDDLMRQAIEENQGVVFKTIGDAFCAAFATAPDALNAALASQRAFSGEPWPNALALRVRMALHTGTVELRDNDYFGPALNRVARLLGAGYGGQALLSSATQTLVGMHLPENVSLRDLGLAPLKDLPELSHLWQLCHPDLPAEFPPLRTLAANVHYLPQSLTEFVGREQETLEAATLLRTPGVRLITLTGFGGMGKSRLAMQIAEQSLFAFLDGVWWLEMEEVTSGRDLIARITERLRLPLQSEESVREQIRLALREKDLLLVLDNLEQIPDAAAILRDLLTGTVALKCLVTSRRVLDLRGERVLELDPLPISDAEALFVSRAQESNANFKRTDDNRNNVTSLCRKLEGVPLAIELAAARSRTLTPRQMEERLSERFRLLQSRSPDLPPRQRALSAVIEWSYCLLEEEERQVMAHLSVFAGGFVLEDAEAVCEAFDVFESIDILRRNSFFRVETEAERQQTRFLMLDSVREYAAERLRETEDWKRFPQRHAERFLARAQGHLAQLRTASEAEALMALETDGDNFYAAETWAREAGVTPLNAELALALGRWRQRRGFGRQAVLFIERGMEALTAASEAPPLVYAALLRERAGLSLDGGEFDLARVRAEEARAISVVQGDANGQAQADNLLGQVAMQEQHFAEARQHFGRSLETFTHAGQEIEIAIVRNNLGLTERRDKAEPDADARWKRSEAHLQEALRLRRTVQDRRGLAETLNALGVLAFERGDLADAKEYYTQALAHERDLQNIYAIALLLANLAEVSQPVDSLYAARLFTASELFLEEIASPLAAMVATMTEGAATEAGLAPEARQTLRATLQSLSSRRRLDFALHGALSS